MKVKSRYYIKSKDNLFFAVNGNNHPKTHYIAFLRYIPSEDGNRVLNGMKYKKVNSAQAYKYLKENHPDYLFDWNISNKKMMGIPVEDVKEIYDPVEGLRKIRYAPNKSKLYEKITLLADIFHENSGIPYESMRISGSCLIGLENEKSDIDYIIYGLENHKKAIEYYSITKNDKHSPLDAINNDYWEFVYNKRIKDNSMTLDEFVWYESRKNNRGLIKGTLFDILLNRLDCEIQENTDVNIKQIEKIKIICDICDDSLSYDSPATYKIENVEFIEGHRRNIEEVLSFTHTYTGIVKNNERVIASGVCEEHTDKQTNKKKYKLIIGTTRESINEYIKLEKSPVNL